MKNTLSTKISLRKDTLANWDLHNPVLLNGEIAIVVDPSGNQQLKVGDGVKKFKELPFLHEKQIETDYIIADAISQGMNSYSKPYGLAAGYGVSAMSQFSQAFGINADASANYSFVWSGDNDLTKDAYKSHGEGTFNINAPDGLSGVYIGDESLAEILKNVDSATDVGELAVSVRNKVSVARTDEGVFGPSDISIWNVSMDKYAELVRENKICGDIYYSIQMSCLDGFGQAVRNVGSPVLSDDAATKGYVDSEIRKIDITDQLGDLYRKNETSSVAELSGMFSRYTTSANVSSMIEEYGGSDVYVNGRKSNLSVRNISDVEYYGLTPAERAISNMIYVVSSENENFFGERLQNVGEPQISSDAATKNYVDSQVSSASGIYINGARSDLSVVNISDVDYYSLSPEARQLSNVMYVISSQNKNFFGERLTNVAEPELSSDAATKNYVDSELAKIDVSGQLTGYAQKDNIQIGYDSAAKKIRLSADGHVTDIDATAFVKDGMLSNAVLSGDMLVLSFNTAAGVTPISVDMNRFVDDYSGSIKVLSDAIKTIGDDYLDGDDETRFYNDFVELDELSLVRNAGQKSITLSVATGGSDAKYTASLSDFMLSSEMSAYQPSGDYLSATADHTTSAQVSAIVEGYNYTKTIFRKWTIEQE